jgi:GAF domain
VLQTKMMRVGSSPENNTNDTMADSSLQHMSACFVGPVEQICSAMSASGAVVAVRDSEGMRCVASAGDAPALGSRLQPDSTFTRECIETGEVALCEDTEKDSRIQPSIAKSLNLRSAVAVPIQAQGSVVGLIEVFSSRPSDIHAADIAVLKQFANLFAYMIVPGTSSGAQPCEPDASFLWLHPELSLATNRTDTKASSAAQEGGSTQVKLDSWHSPVSLGFACSAVRRRFQLQDEKSVTARGRLKDTLAHILLRFAGKTNGAQRWRRRAASLSLLALLFFFSCFFALAGVFRPMAVKPAADSAAPPAARKARYDEAWTLGKEARGGKGVRGKGFNSSSRSSRLGVSHSKDE